MQTDVPFEAPAHNCSLQVTPATTATCAAVAGGPSPVVQDFSTGRKVSMQLLQQSEWCAASGGQHRVSRSRRLPPLSDIIVWSVPHIEGHAGGCQRLRAGRCAGDTACHAHRCGHRRPLLRDIALQVSTPCPPSDPSQRRPAPNLAAGLSVHAEAGPLHRFSPLVPVLFWHAVLHESPVRVWGQVGL